MIKNNRLLFILSSHIAASTLLAFSSVSFGEKMSLEAHDLVIQKLESSLNQIDDADNVMDTTGLHLQLGNLYSDKSRLLFLEEEKKDCNNCLKSEVFREKALGQYRTIRSKLRGVDHEKISFQMGHLYELGKNDKEALKIYNELIQSKRSSDGALAKAYSKRASFYFSQGDFSKALSDYNMVLSKSSPQEKGPILHRMAWAQLNKGQVQTATQQLWMVIENEEYLMMPNAKGFAYSPSFHTEVARDLAVFLAKAPLKAEIIERLTESCPEGEKVETLLLLGDEAERTGQSKGAIMAWDMALKDRSFPDDKKPETYLKIAQLYRGDLQFKLANQFFAQALTTEESVFGADSGKGKCDENCLQRRKEFKAFLSQWDRETRKWNSGPLSQESKMGLIEAYSQFHKFHNFDFQTHLGLAQLSNHMKQKQTAMRAFSRAADLISEKGSANDKKLLEPTLLSEVSLAEELGNNEIKLRAYEHYLELNYLGAKQNAIRFQRAKVVYDLKRWDDAYKFFDECVVDPNFKDPTLKLKAAHLSLDALVFAKKLETLEAKGLQYAKIFPQDRSVFLKISRNAGIEIVKTIALTKVSVESAQRALAKMNTISLDPQDKEEYQRLLKMKIDLSLKAQEWTSARRTLEEFSRISGLKMTDKIWALKQNLRLAELFLDFKTAIVLMKELGYFSSQNPQELMKGALMTELGGGDPTPWLEKVLRLRKISSSDQMVAQAQLVRASKNKWGALKAFLTSLSRKPELVGDLALESYMENPKESEALFILSVRKVASTWSGQFLYRLIQMNKIGAWSSSIQKQQLNTRSNALLASSLQNRIKTLQQLQSQFKIYQRSKDWSLQVFAGHALAAENLRLADDIEALPAPRTLSQKEKALFAQELIRQASPFRNTGHEFEQFVNSSWKNIAYIQGLITKAEVALKIQPLFQRELEKLEAIAPDSISGDIEEVLNKMSKRLSVRNKISDLQKDLREDPLNESILTDLIKAEKLVGNETMATFLVARQNSFKGGF